VATLTARQLPVPFFNASEMTGRAVQTVPEQPIALRETTFRPCSNVSVSTQARSCRRPGHAVRHVTPARATVRSWCPLRRPFSPLSSSAKFRGCEASTRKSS